MCQSTAIVEEHPRTRDREDISVRRCEACDLLFLDRTDHITDEFYEQSGMFDYALPDPATLGAEEHRDTTRRTAALRDLVQGKAYLDFGCGTGNTLRTLAKLTRVARGVEPNEVLRRHIEQADVPCYPSLEAVEGTYDVISLFHVLEHIADPRDVLKQLKRHLNADGMIYVEVPSANDALLELYELEAFKNFTFWSCHLFLFHGRHLVDLAKQSGLEIEAIEQIQRYPLSNHLHWLARGKPGGHKKWSFLDTPELEAAYAKALARLNLCDTWVARMRLPR
jgi:2-polyprenyl-3-methyl-5-hydroxy-6-metoxy-1,4-benzoquinol methylase